MAGKELKISKIGDMSKLNNNINSASLSNLFGGTKQVKVADVQTAEPFKSLFIVSDEMLNSIVESMRVGGYDKNQPIIIWQEKDVLIDGHTRLKAALQVGIDTIPAFYASFNDEEAVLDYMYSVQFNRRNITDGELLTIAVQALSKYQKVYGEGSKAEFLVGKLKGLSLTKAKRLIIIIECENFGNIQKLILIENETINSAYNKLQKDKKTPKQKVHTDFFNDDYTCPVRSDDTGTFYYRNYENKKEYKAFSLPANMNTPRIRERIQQVLDEELR